MVVLTGVSVTLNIKAMRVDCVEDVTDLPSLAHQVVPALESLLADATEKVRARVMV